MLAKKMKIGTKCEEDTLQSTAEESIFKIQYQQQESTHGTLVQVLGLFA